LYSPPVSPQKIIDIIDWMDDELINALKPKLIGDRPNTYTYTKALAESLLVDECGPLPVAIVRPSIVTSSWREPMPGWVESLNGATGLIVGLGKGVFRSMLSDLKASADFVPVDTVVNLMIAVAWNITIQRPNGVMLYNCTSGQSNGLTWGEAEKINYPLILQYPSTQIFRYPIRNFIESRYLHKTYWLFDHMIAYIFDATMAIMGRKQM
jgi:fatty acyl-CoA reductase